MSEQLFPYANWVVGILVFVIGFLLHWVGQIICLANWDLAERIGIADKHTTPEYKTYELGIATADALIGWIYGIVAVGLFLNLPWAYKLAWIPGVIFIYHSLSFWFWIRYQIKLGKPTASNTLRTVWFWANFLTGILAVWMAWRY